MSEIALEDILITSELRARPVRSRNPAAEKAAYLSVAGQLHADGAHVLQALVDAAIDLCMNGKSGTAGISMLEPQPDGTVLFRWTVLSGRLAGFVSGTTPRDFSPCGACLDRAAAALFSYPERRFTYFQATGAPFVEALVLPFSVGGRHAGTLWIVTHDATHSFDGADLQVMTELAGFAGLAYASVIHHAV